MTKYFLLLLGALNYYQVRAQSISLVKTDESYYSKNKLISTKCDSLYGKVILSNNTVLVNKLRGYTVTRKEYCFDKKEFDSQSNTLHYYSFGLEAIYDITNNKLIITRTTRILNKSKSLQIMPMPVWYYEVCKTTYYGVSL